MIWKRGRLSLLRCLILGCVCLKRRMQTALLSSAVVLLMTAQGCSWDSSTPDVPTLPVLTSLQRLELNRTPGVWMNSDDAGRLAQWIYDVTGEAGR